MPTRRDLMAGCAASLLVPAAARSGTPARRVIVMFAPGGWDVSYVFDPKPGVETVDGPELDQDPTDPDDVEAVRTFSGIPVAVNEAKRPNVSRFFAAWAPRVAVVNGIQVGTISHRLGTTRMLTGLQSTIPGPDLAVVAGAQHGEALPFGCLAMSGYSSSGGLAASTVSVGANSQLGALLVDGSPLPAPPGEPAFPRHTLSDGDRALLEAHRRGRIEELSQRWTGSDRSAARIAGLVESGVRADDIRAHADVITGVLEPGRPLDTEAQIRLAVEVLRQGICHSVLASHDRNFDTHIGNDQQHEMFDELFADLSLLAERLEAAALLDDTLVVVLSEFTRTPYRNPRGGKDHWPFTSAMLFGGGTVGGQALGRSDDHLQALPVDLRTGLPDEGGVPLTYGSFVAGLLERLDVDPAAWIPGVEPWRGAT